MTPGDGLVYISVGIVGRTVESLEYSIFSLQACLLMNEIRARRASAIRSDQFAMIMMGILDTRTRNSP